MNQVSNLTPKGEVHIIIEHSDGTIEEKWIKNSVLRTGREALSASLANQIGDSYGFYINRMLFGDGGTDSGTGIPKYVNSERNGLFGVTRASKGVSAVIDPNLQSQVVFTTVLGFDEGNYTLNEMALQMASGDLYSMATFPDFTKTSSMQMTWNWQISFV